MITKAQEILDIIEPIPAERFITYDYGTEDGRSCFLGHIHRRLNFQGDESNYMGDFNGFGARDLTGKFLENVHGLQDIDGADVNNRNDINGYNEKGIKDRVMHMLNDMVAAGY